MEILKLVPVQDIQAMQISSNIDQILLDAQIELWFVRHGICSRYDTLLTIMMSSTHNNSIWNYLNVFEPWHNQDSQVHNKSHTMVKSPDAWHSTQKKRKMTLVRFQFSNITRTSRINSRSGFHGSIKFHCICPIHSYHICIPHAANRFPQSFGLSLPSPIQSIIKS